MILVYEYDNKGISVAMIRANMISYDNNSEELFLSNMNILLNTHVPYVEFRNSPDTICLETPLIPYADMKKYVGMHFFSHSLG